MGIRKITRRIRKALFNLIRGLRPVRAAQPRQKAVMVGKVAEPRLKPVLARAIRVPADHHGAHVVVKHLVRRAADERKRRLVARHQRLEPLVGDELHVGRSAVTQHSDEHRMRIGAAADHRPVHLHLSARLRLEPHHRLDGHNGP